MADTPRRTRPRKDGMTFDAETIGKRVVDFFNEDILDRTVALENHLQRYAKYRMWVSGEKTSPWENCSDVSLPDMMTHSLKVQDTLHNAVMSTRPTVLAKAIEKSNKDKESTINDLLDFQFFVENKGELKIGELADCFVNSPVVTVFTPWVKEEREGHEIFTLPPIPDAATPTQYFETFLRGAYHGKVFRLAGKKDGWSWEISEGNDEWTPVEFYTVGRAIEMDATKKKQVIFNGPCPIVKDYEDILAPPRCANLQIPGPSNPGGAAHVIMVDYPTLDEIKRLKASGFYDIVTDEDMKKFETTSNDRTTGQLSKEQKDAFEGKAPPTDTKNMKQTPGHRPLTRLTCFDLYDVDGDGVDEDVIWWVIKETQTVLRARHLTQVYPTNPPRRPFSESCFLPVPGRREGISLLEMMEGLHDAIKQFADQTVDGGTMSMIPWGTYRASGSMRPEVIRMQPGELYPTSDPKNDIHFPQMPTQGSAFGFNLITMFGQWEEKLTNIGDLQLGRVPQGKASALRTVRGMQSVMGQGEARPERILRRFFLLLSEMFAQMHELNQVFLERDKQYRVTGVKKPNEDPFRTVKDPGAIRGRFQFDFVANAMNTSKEALQEALEKAMGILISPLMIQMGIAQPDGVYQLVRDYFKAIGQDADKYATPPTPESTLPKMFANEVLSVIMQDGIPECRPAEPTAMEHMAVLIEFRNTDEFGHLTTAQVDVFHTYLNKLAMRIQAEQRQQALMAAAAQFQGAGQGDGMPGPDGAPPDQTPTLSQPGKINDMSMPGAGGGANNQPLQ